MESMNVQVKGMWRVKDLKQKLKRNVANVAATECARGRLVDKDDEGAPGPDYLCNFLDLYNEHQRDW